MDNLVIRKCHEIRLPEFSNNVEDLIKREIAGTKYHEYHNTSSTLVYNLFEFCLIFEAEEIFNTYREPLTQGINLLDYIPGTDQVEIEHSIFHEELLETGGQLMTPIPASFHDFRLKVKQRHDREIQSFSSTEHEREHILILACKHYQSPLLPFLWRREINFPNV